MELTTVLVPAAIEVDFLVRREHLAAFLTVVAAAADVGACDMDTEGVCFYLQSRSEVGY